MLSPRVHNEQEIGIELGMEPGLEPSTPVCDVGLPSGIFIASPNTYPPIIYFSGKIQMDVDTTQPTSLFLYSYFVFLSPINLLRKSAHSFNIVMCSLILFICSFGTMISIREYSYQDYSHCVQNIP